jgi:hypothetical protein
LSDRKPGSSPYSQLPAPVCCTLCTCRGVVCVCVCVQQAAERHSAVITHTAP